MVAESSYVIQVMFLGVIFVQIIVLRHFFSWFRSSEAYLTPPSSHSPSHSLTSSKEVKICLIPLSLIIFTSNCLGKDLLYSRNVHTPSMSHFPPIDSLRHHT